MPLPDIAQEIIDWIDFARADSWSKNAKGLRRSFDDALRSISLSLRQLLSGELREVRVHINAGTSGTALPAARQLLRRALVALNAGAHPSGQLQGTAAGSGGRRASGHPDNG